MAVAFFRWSRGLRDRNDIVSPCLKFSGAAISDVEYGDTLYVSYGRGLLQANLATARHNLTLQRYRTSPLEESF